MTYKSDVSFASSSMWPQHKAFCDDFTRLEADLLRSQVKNSCSSEKIAQLVRMRFAGDI